MACFIVPAAEAVIISVAKKAAEKKAASDAQTNESGSSAVISNDTRISFVEKLGWLIKMLAGGAILLAFEHLWHGEIVPFFPFLTAASDPGSTAEMLHEMSTTGVLMAVIVTAVWAGMIAVSKVLESRAVSQASSVIKEADK